MAGPNYFWKAVWWLTHVGLAPVQAWVTVIDAVWSSVRTVLDTWRNLLKTLAYPFTTKTWKPKWKEDYQKTWWKEWFSGRQKDHWNKYVAPFKWDANQTPLLAKATGWVAHFATAIPANAIMTTLDATYSAVQTPFSILKNIWKTVLYPFTTKTWKPTFGKDLKEIWWNDKWFAARTKNSWKETFDVMPEKWARWNDKIEEEWWDEEDKIETINTQVQAKPIEKKSPEAPKAEAKSDWKKSDWEKKSDSKDTKDTDKTKQEIDKKDENTEKNKTEKEELKKDTIITRDIIKDNPDTIFVFWDNLEAKKADTEAVKQKWENKDVVEKSWWQAKEMRAKIKNGKKDIENSLGIPTMKWFGDFMNDNELDENKKNIDEAISEIKKSAKWKKIHIPFDYKKNQYNIWTGVADLENKAPKTFKYLQGELKKLDEWGVKNSRGYEVDFRWNKDNSYSMAA